jgi:hypothetical protein
MNKTSDKNVKVVKNTKNSRYKSNIINKKKRRKRKKIIRLIFTFFLLITFIISIIIFSKIVKDKYTKGATENSNEIANNYESTQINNNLVATILNAYPEKFKNILDNANKYEVQILYTQINRKDDGSISFTENGFNLDKNKYFYPASSIKLATAIVALDKVNNLKINGLNKYSTMEIKSGRPSQTSEKEDMDSKNKKPSIAQYIKELLVVSDNNAFNRLYEFIGQQQLNETLWNKGYKDILIRQRIADTPMTDENRYTNPITFYDNKGKKIYDQPMAYNSKIYELPIPYENTQKGTKHEDDDGEIINGPHDFSESNYVSIETLQNLLKAVMFPQSIDKNNHFNLTEDDLKYLRKYLSILPRDCTYPSYDELPDNYGKYFMYGSEDSDIPTNIKIYNKIGNAYGYLIDNAYIVDSENNVEFLLTAVVYSNEDGIFAESHFNNDKIGMPFLTDLGNVIYEYELNGRTLKNK